MKESSDIESLEMGSAAGEVIGATQARSTLDPNIWDSSQHIKEKVQNVLTKIAQDFIQSWDVGSYTNVSDIIITGSTAGFNWTNSSDIDLHIVVPLDHISNNREAVAKLLTSKATLWNAKHNIKIFGHPVELYVQDAKEPHIAPGMYSILKQDWLQRPTRASGLINSEQIYTLASRYMECLKYLQALYNQGHFQQVYELSEQLRAFIKAKRSESLHGEEGISSTGNLVFKTLRKAGVLDKLAKLQTDAYDQLSSLQEILAEVPPIKLDEVIEALTHPETGFSSKPVEHQQSIAQIIIDALKGTGAEASARRKTVSYLKANSFLRAGLKAIIYDLLEYQALDDFVDVIAKDGLMPFSELGNSGNLISKFQQYYSNYPQLSNPKLLESLASITGAAKTVNIGKGELCIALLCKNVDGSSSSSGDLVADGKSIEIKGSDARAISQKSGYRENSDKVILSALQKKFGVVVPGQTSGRFPQKLAVAMKLYISMATELGIKPFVTELNKLITTVYRGIVMPPLMLNGVPNPEYFTQVGVLNADNLERDMAYTLLKDYVGHHAFDTWLFLNTKNFNYYIVGREEVLQVASTDRTSPIWLYVRDGTVRMVYNKFTAPTPLDEEVQEVYHASFKSDPSQLAASETIKDAALAAQHQSKTGFLGTGLYVFGNPEVAQEYAKFMGERPDRSGAQIFKFNLNGLNMFRPSNPEEFVSDIRVTTINIAHLQGPELKEEILEASQELGRHIKMSPDSIARILARFAKDLKQPATAKEEVQLSNRLLAKYDGIDLTGTSKDHFGTGSVIFPKAIQKVVQNVQVS